MMTPVEKRREAYMDLHLAALHIHELGMHRLARKVDHLAAEVTEGRHDEGGD